MEFQDHEIQVFCDRTSWKNIAYYIQSDGRDGSIERGRSEEERIQRAVSSLLTDRLSQYGDGSRILIYHCGRTTSAVALAQVLQCPCYHSKIGTDAEKSQILTQFLSGFRPVLVATSALGVGVDVPNVRVVIHVGLRNTLMEYIQESGRAGRDGQPSEAILLHSHLDSPADRSYFHAKSSIEAAM